MFELPFWSSGSVANVSAWHWLGYIVYVQFPLLVRRVRVMARVMARVCVRVRVSISVRVRVSKVLGSG